MATKIVRTRIGSMVVESEVETPDPPKQPSAKKATSKASRKTKAITTDEPSLAEVLSGEVALDGDGRSAGSCGLEKPRTSRRNGRDS